MHPAPTTSGLQEPDSLPERKQGALEKAGVEGGLLQGIECAFDLIRLSSIFSGVFF
jgi:hypothetical protein